MWSHDREDEDYDEPLGVFRGLTHMFLVAVILYPILGLVGYLVYLCRNGLL